MKGNNILLACTLNIFKSNKSVLHIVLEVNKQSCKYRRVNEFSF